MMIDSKLDTISRRYEELRDTLAAGQIGGDSFAKVSKEMSDLEPIVEAAADLKKKKQNFADTEAMMEDPDPEIRQMAKEEYYVLKDDIATAEKALQLMLIPKDADDEKNAILEVRAGTGGEEAALFAAALFRMYELYAKQKGWAFEVLSINDTGIGGYKEASARITGRDVFSRLKFESGVHRVQRVPETESSGRVHTSAATVAVLPEATDVDFKIDDKDLKIDVYRSSGAGGQHVNKTESAVRITHLPTNEVVTCQDERSQLKNRERAMNILRSRLYEKERQRLADERSENRKSQVGSGDRSERIRTYNFPQSRVTDHRINLTTHQIDDVMNGTALDELITPLIQDDQLRKLAELDGSY